MMRYSLAEHVHICRVDGHIFVLDVKADRYRALPAAATAALEELVEGWPTADLRQHARSNPNAVAEALVRQGILAAGQAGKKATPVRNALPGAELLDERRRNEEKLRLAWSVLAGLASATLTLRRCSFEQLVRRVAARKRPTAAAFDFGQAAQLVWQLRSMRAFCYTSRNACLFESFALLELLARRKSFPDWVFGIRASPFGAHCWLQQGDVVLNDTLEHVRHFTPIMIV